MNLQDVKVVMFKHHSPFNGCFWEYQHIAQVMDSDIEANPDKETVLYPITWRSQKSWGARFPANVQEFVENSKFDDVWIEPWKEHYEYNEHNTPAFWQFAQENDLPFVWDCQSCGETRERPVDHGGNYSGNGGVGIVVYGWYCEECYCGLTCAYCGELNDPDSPWWDYSEELTAEYNRGICPSCHEER